MRRRMGRGETHERSAYRKITGAEFVGNKFVGDTGIDRAIVIPEQRDALWEDAECLVGIARRHAAVALACPADVRASHLAACRTVWLHYAAAFSTSPVSHERFADALQDATRALMATQREAEGLPPDTLWECHSNEPPQAVDEIITIEELRSILRQIIRQ